MSIIIPLWQAERYLPAALASIDTQSWTRWEVILVADGGDTSCREIAETFRSSHPAQRVVFSVRGTHGGPGASRNHGLSLAHGDYVAFLDHDDVWERGYLEQGVRYLDGRERAVLFTQCENFGDDRRLVPNAHRLMTWELENLSALLLARNPFVPSATMATRDSLPDFPTHVWIGEDWLLWHACLNAGCEVLFNPKPLVNYRISPGSLTSRPLKVQLTVCRVVMGMIRKQPLDQQVAAGRVMPEIASISFGHWWGALRFALCRLVVSRRGVGSLLAIIFAGLRRPFGRRPDRPCPTSLWTSA